MDGFLQGWVIAAIVFFAVVQAVVTGCIWYAVWYAHWRCINNNLLIQQRRDDHGRVLGDIKTLESELKDLRKHVFSRVSEEDFEEFTSDLAEGLRELADRVEGKQEEDNE